MVNRKKNRPGKKSNNKKGRASRKSAFMRDKVAALESGLLKPRQPRSDRHVLVALTMSSLIAGLLLVINCDRATNAAAATELGGGASLHGWPFHYLQREFRSFPEYLMAKKINNWPLPVDPAEFRTMNYQNLLMNIVCCGGIVLVSYFLIRRIVWRYDQWKQSWT